MYISMSICIYLYLLAFDYIYRPVYQCIMYLFLFVLLPVYTGLSIYLPAYLTYLCIYPSLSLYLHNSACLSAYPST